MLVVTNALAYFTTVLRVEKVLLYIPVAKSLDALSSPKIYLTYSLGPML